MTYLQNLGALTNQLSNRNYQLCLFVLVFSKCFCFRFGASNKRLNHANPAHKNTDCAQAAHYIKFDDNDDDENIAMTFSMIILMIMNT